MPPARPGPKAPITAPPLDFSDLPPRGWKRIDAFALEYLKVPKGLEFKELKELLGLKDQKVLKGLEVLKELKELKGR